MKTHIITLAVMFTSLLSACIGHANDVQTHKDFEHYSVHFSVFNSTFIPADVAKAYGIKRSKYESLINVSISPVGEYGALPGKVNGTVTNLMQQQNILEFIEIKEKNATYYIAPLRISGEETVRIELSVTPEGSETALPVSFNKKLYSDP